MLAATLVGLSNLEAPSSVPSVPEGPLNDGVLDDDLLDDGTLDEETRSAKLDSEASRMPESGRVELLLRPYAEDGRRAVLGGRKYRLPGST